MPNSNDNQTRYEARVKDAGLIRIHPYIQAHKKDQVLDLVKAIREGTLTDIDRIDWLDSRDNNMDRVRVLWTKAYTIREAIDFLILEDRSK